MGQRELPLCGVCNKETASIVCVDCDPGNHFKFCVACDSSEHTRPFGPAQRHRRFPIDKAPIPSTKISCSRHTSVTAVYYLVGVDEFACNLCKADEDWSVRGSQVDLLTNATKNMRLKVQKLTKYTGDISKKLTESKSNLERTMSSLEPESMALKAEISKTFSQCIEVLQERQRKLLSNVEVEVSFLLICTSIYGNGLLILVEYRLASVWHAGTTSRVDIRLDNLSIKILIRLPWFLL